MVEVRSLPPCMPLPRSMLQLDSVEGTALASLVGLNSLALHTVMHPAVLAPLTALTALTWDKRGAIPRAALDVNEPRIDMVTQLPK